MTPLFKKLNLKLQDEIVVLNAPASFEAELEALDGVRVRRTLRGVRAVDFALAFVIQRKELDRVFEAIAARAEGDAVVWLAYPKKSSKRYRCELDRDSGWQVLGDAGFEPVRMVAIDEDWSALRFRRVEHVKIMTRAKKAALTAAGRRKTTGR